MGDDLLRNIESQPYSLYRILLRLLNPNKALKDSRLLVLWDTNATILYA